MQKKTLLYVFALAAFLGLVLGGWFFANELRMKIIQGPDKNQFAGESGVGALSAGSSSAKPSAPNPAVPPTPPAQANPPEKTDAPEPPPANDPAPTKQDEKTDSFSFAIIGDTQRFDPEKSDGGLQQAVKNITSKNPDMVMAEGDLLGSCDGGSKCEAKLVDWKNTLSTLYSKTYEIMGEHDRSGKDKSDSLWQRLFANLPQNGPEGYKGLVYSFDFKNSHFVILNSEKPKEHAVDKTQRDWLDQDLANNKKDNTFVFFHEPAYPVSGEVGSSLDANKEERDALWKILENHKVTAIFNGHERIVSRKKIGDIYQYVFGNTDSADQELPKSGVTDYSYKGKSYGIVEIKGKEVTVNVYSVDGNLLDSFKIPA